MESPDDIRQRARQEAARTRRAVRDSRDLKSRVDATLARSRLLHARLLSDRLLDKYRR